jgi:hypothetical protein
MPNWVSALILETAVLAALSHFGTKSSMPHLPLHLVYGGLVKGLLTGFL